MTAPPYELTGDGEENLCLSGYQEIPLSSSCATCFPQAFVKYRHFAIQFVHKHSRQPGLFLVQLIYRNSSEEDYSADGGDTQNSSHIHYKQNPRSRE